MITSAFSFRPVFGAEVSTVPELNLQTLIDLGAAETDLGAKNPATLELLVCHGQFERLKD